MTSAADSRLRVGLAWGVHILTASGAVIGVVSLLAIAASDFTRAALLMLAALAIDSVDGTLARRVGVSEVLPDVDGRRLDDLVDYLNYVIVPAVFLVWSGGVTSWLWAALPVLASAYGFSQAHAKTDDHYFLGFPSYWNVVAIYIWALEVTPGVAAAWLTGLSIAVFVPIKYVYPSYMKVLPLTTKLGAGLWILVVAAALAFPERLGRLPLIELSLAYPIFYVGVSLWLGGLRHRRAG